MALQERVRELELAAKTRQESSGLYVPLHARMFVQFFWDLHAALQLTRKFSFSSHSPLSHLSKDLVLGRRSRALKRGWLDVLEREPVVGLVRLTPATCAVVDR